MILIVWMVLTEEKRENPFCLLRLNSSRYRSWTSLMVNIWINYFKRKKIHTIGQFLWTSAQQPLQVVKQFFCIQPLYFPSLQNLHTSETCIFKKMQCSKFKKRKQVCPANFLDCSEVEPKSLLKIWCSMSKIIFFAETLKNLPTTCGKVKHKLFSKRGAVNIFPPLFLPDVAGVWSDSASNFVVNGTFRLIFLLLFFLLPPTFFLLDLTHFNHLNYCTAINCMILHSHCLHTV